MRADRSRCGVRCEASFAAQPSYRRSLLVSEDIGRVWVCIMYTSWSPPRTLLALLSARGGNTGKGWALLPTCLLDKALKIFADGAAVVK